VDERQLTSVALCLAVAVVAAALYLSVCNRVVSGFFSLCFAQGSNILDVYILNAINMRMINIEENHYGKTNS